MIRLALLIAAVAVSLGIATAATAEGLTPSTLIKAGWTCFNDPGAPRIVCSDPGHGRPVIPAPPDRPASYNFKIFSLGGTFLGNSGCQVDPRRRANCAVSELVLMASRVRAKRASAGTDGNLPLLDTPDPERSVPYDPRA